MISRGINNIKIYEHELICVEKNAYLESEKQRCISLSAE